MKILQDIFAPYYNHQPMNKHAYVEGFSCEHKGICQFDEKTQTNHTPVIVNSASQRCIFVVMEAPSVSKGNTGAWIGGSLSDWKDAKMYYALFKMVKVAFPSHTIIATDAVKCGVAKQSDKTLLELRKSTCANKFLKREFADFRPERIFCAGRHAWHSVRDLQKANVIDPMIPVHYVTHPSGAAFMSREEKTMKWKQALKSALSANQNLKD